jgi:tetratricopeptide (TPR) repeat protein
MNEKGRETQETQITQIKNILSKSVNSDQRISNIVELKKLERLSVDREISAFLCNTIAEELSFIGNYKESLHYMDKYSHIANTDPKYYDQISETYKPRKAIEYIQSIASTNQVIFINEAHNIPSHRAFSSQLLDVLYENGFRYFAAETLNSFDTNLQDRGYPLLNKSGYYTNEPLYGDLVRIALRLGYTIVPYESEIPCKNPITLDDAITKEHKSDTFDWKCQNFREYNQALNLFDRILKNDPKAKIFVHAGYGHVKKIGTKSWTPMGEYFQRLTGISPYVIDQETMREHSAREFESQNYKYITNKYTFNSPIILQSLDKKIWIDKESQGQYDVQVIHPRTTFIYGRPHWLSLNGSRKPYYIKSNNNLGTQLPYLASAYYKHEETNAVPIDRIVLLGRSDHKPLMLPNGSFRIIVNDSFGKVIENYSITLSH